MCIPSFDEFIANNPKYKKYSESKGAKDTYDYLKLVESIDKMVAANSNGKPALYGVQKHIETNLSGFSDFDFNEGFVKQCVGSMVREILAPLGYKPFLQRDLPKKESLYFTSAMNYAFDESLAKCRLVKKLEIEKL